MICFRRNVCDLVLDFTVTETAVTCSEQIWNTERHFLNRRFVWKMKYEEIPFSKKKKWRSQR
jgi:hypothetical protein